MSPHTIFDKLTFLSIRRSKECLEVLEVRGHNRMITHKQHSIFSSHTAYNIKSPSMHKCRYDRVASKVLFLSFSNLNLAN